MSFSVRHPKSIIALFLMVLLYGSISLSRLPIERLPNIIIPEAVVVCERTGLPADDMESMITIPLEKAMAGIPGVIETRSITKQGISRVCLCFDWNTDITEKAILVREAADAVYPALPEGTDRPYVDFRQADGAPFIELSFFPEEDTGNLKASDIMRNDILHRFHRLEGVASVRLLGADEEEIKVFADSEKLASLGITVGHITESLSAHMFSLPLGTIEDGLEHRVIASTNVRTIEDIKALPLAVSSGYITVGEGATVCRGTKEIRSLYCAGNTSAYGILLSKTAGADAADISHRVRDLLDDINSEFRGVLRGAVLYDGTEDISSSLRSAVVSLLLGAGAAMLTVLLVYRDLRVGLIISINLPASLFLVFPVMDLLSLHLNTISLLGMAVASGMVVDNAIVVFEGITEESASTAEEVIQAVRKAVAPVLGSTVSTVLVFLPVMLIPGIMGALFRDLVLSIALFLSGSFFWALVLTPALYMLLIHKTHGMPRFAPAGLQKRFFTWSKPLSRHPRSAALFLAAFGVICALVLLQRGTRLFPEGTSRYIEFTLDLDPALPVEEVHQRLLGLSSLTGFRQDETAWFRAFSGCDAASVPDKSDPENELYHVRGVMKVNRPCTTEDALRFQDHITAFEGCLRGTARLRRVGIERILEGGQLCSYIVTAPTRPEAEKKAVQLAETITRVNEDIRLRFGQEKICPASELRLDYDKLADSGVDCTSVMRLLRRNIQGDIAAVLEEEERRSDVRVLLQSDRSRHIEDILNHSVPVENGFISLKELGVLNESKTYPYLLRIDRSPAIELFAELPFRAEVPVRDGPGIRRVENQTAEARRIGRTFAAAILLIYLFLVFLFENFLQPLFMLTIVGAGITGSLTALAVGGLSLNLYSCLGLLIMTGTSLNMVILVSEKMGGEGTTASALTMAFPGIFTSTFTTLTALVPLFFLGDGPDIPAVMSGGLAFSMVYSLTVYPRLWKAGTL